MTMSDNDDTDQGHDAGLSAAELKRLSPLDWARYGAQRIAYVRPVVVNGQAAIAIHAADGTPIGAAPSVDLATAAILQHGMGAARVH
jgi:hypothetical protein